MKTAKLVTSKKTCPFIQRNFDLDITQSQISTDFIKKFGVSCPYLMTQKLQKKSQKAQEAIKYSINQEKKKIQNNFSNLISEQNNSEEQQQSKILQAKSGNCAKQSMCPFKTGKFQEGTCPAGLKLTQKLFEMCNINTEQNENIQHSMQVQQQELDDLKQQQSEIGFNEFYQIHQNINADQQAQQYDDLPGLEQETPINSDSLMQKTRTAQTFSQISDNNVQSENIDNSIATVVEQNDSYTTKFSSAIGKLKTEKRYRVFNYIERMAGQYPKAKMTDEEGLVKEITVWCSNDYLGMGEEVAVQDAMINSIRKQGAGAGGTRNIGGSSTEHGLLEQDLAKFHSQQSAVVCSSGFVANQASMNALATVMPDIVFLSDEKNHASIIEGMKNSRADKVVWKHNDLEDLENKLARCDYDRPKCIVFESVYSMSGNISPIEGIIKLAKKYNALTFIDEVHAIGLYGPKGAGVAQQLGVEHQIDFISGTMAKGIGCFGGYVVGKKESIDCIRSYAPNFIFTTSIPPSVAAAARSSLKIIQEKQELRDKLHKVAWKLKKKFFQLGIRMEPSQSHIVPVFIGCAEKAKKVSDLILQKNGHYIQPINFPTVARGQELLRISPSPTHTQEMIDDLANSLFEAFQEIGVQTAISGGNSEDGFMYRGDKYRIFMENMPPFDSTQKEAFFSNRGQQAQIKQYLLNQKKQNFMQNNQNIEAENDYEDASQQLIELEHSQYVQ